MFNVILRERGEYGDVLFCVACRDLKEVNEALVHMAWLVDHSHRKPESVVVEVLFPEDAGDNPFAE